MDRLLLLLGLALIVSLCNALCGKYNCISGQAECRNGACACVAPFSKGNGNFACYKDKYVAAEIKNDPELVSFNNETSPFPFPCRYMVTHIKQKLKNSNGDEIGWCQFQIYAFNAKSPTRGKFAAHGFDVAAKIKYNRGGMVQMSSRNYGKAANGVYSFTTKGTMGQFKPNGPWGDDYIDYNDDDNGVKVRVTMDTDNNRLRFEAYKCGLVITFAPYEIELKPKDHEWVPGLSVAVNKNMNKDFLAHGSVMALPPIDEGGQLYSEIITGGLDEEQSLLTRAFTNGYEQNQPNDDNGKCAEVGSALGSCRQNLGELHKAFRSCHWMLKEPRFVRCIDDTAGSRKILKLFKKCVNMWCGNMECSTVQDYITDKGCNAVADIGKLTKFMAGELCPQ